MVHQKQGNVSFHRTHRAFLSARALLAILLLGVLAGNWLMGHRGMLWMVTGAGYALMALLIWAWPSDTTGSHADTHRPPPTLSTRQATFSIGVDLVFFSFLQHTTSNNLNSEALLALPVLMAGVLMPRSVALGVAAAASLNLLGAAWIQGQVQNNLGAPLTQAGLTGFGLFAIAALASELAARVAREEQTARGSMELARQQAQLNRLVMEEMTEGVLVLDRQGRVRVANPAARQLLTPGSHQTRQGFQLPIGAVWQELAQAVDQALQSPLHAETGQEIKLQFEDGSRRDLHVRIRFTRGHTAIQSEDMCMLWLEDSRIVRTRLRKDKLAAMGRMSAGIAHEIRNPLSAISQANALLSEDARTPTQHRLTRMISDNVTRLQRTVEDILTIAPGMRSAAPAIEPVSTVRRICEEWQEIHGLRKGEASLLELNIWSQLLTQPPMRVRFEPEHLQRVLVNLLDNGFRHGSGQPGSIKVSLSRLNNRERGQALLLLSVGSEGKPLDREGEQSLFEPFYSTRSRGTGLGLYICKELCERYGAVIDYRQHPTEVRHCNEFFVTIPIESDSPIAPTHELARPPSTPGS